MKSKCKAFVVAALVLIVGLSLTACGGQKTAATDEKGGTVKLEMWVQATDSPEGKLYKQQIEEFNKAHEGKINVKLLAIPRGGESSGYDGRINTGLATKKLPDLLMVDGPNVAAYAESGIIAPIDKYFGEDDLKDFTASIKQQGTYKGKLYQIGAMESTVVLYYNKAMFKANGITPPSKVGEAWTWDELLRYATLLTKDGKRGLDLHMDEAASEGEWLIYAYLPFIFSNGGDVISPDGSTTQGYLNGPKTVEAFSFAAKLFKEAGVNVAPKATDFEEGNVAMVFSGPWMIANLKDYPNLEWGMMPYPVSPASKKGVSPCGSWGFSVTAQSQHPQEAAEVIKWMTSTQACLDMYKANGMLPTRLSAFDKVEELKQFPYTIMTEQVQTTAQARPLTPIYPVLSQKFSEAFKAVALGQDPQKVLDDIAKYVDQEIKKMKK